MAKRFTVAEAKARFADCLRSVEYGSPIVITRHGRQVAAMVSLSDFEQVERLRAAGPEAGLTAVAGGWKGSEDLADAITPPRRSAARRLPKL